MGDYRFDPEFFPDPEAMVRELDEMGIALMVSVWPQIALTSENYEEMRERGLLVRCDKGVQVCMQFVEDSVFYDATNPEAQKYVFDKCKRSYLDKGVKLFWLDEAEPEYAGYDFDNYRYYMGPNAQNRQHLSAAVLQGLLRRHARAGAAGDSEPGQMRLGGQPAVWRVGVVGRHTFDLAGHAQPDLRRAQHGGRGHRLGGRPT